MYSKYVNDIINSAQHGFRPGYSCTSQLINIVEHLAKDMDLQKQIDMIFLDFSKAFDTCHIIFVFVNNMC